MVMWVSQAVHLQSHHLFSTNLPDSSFITCTEMVDLTEIMPWVWYGNKNSDLCNANQLRQICGCDVYLKLCLFIHAYLNDTTLSYISPYKAPIAHPLEATWKHLALLANYSIAEQWKRRKGLPVCLLQNLTSPVILFHSSIGVSGESVGNTVHLKYTRSIRDSNRAKNNLF